MAADPKQIIADELAKPASLTSNAGSVGRRTINELIDGAAFVAANEAKPQPLRGMLITKLIPPGAG